MLKTAFPVTDISACLTKEGAYTWKVEEMKNLAW